MAMMCEIHLSFAPVTNRSHAGCLHSMGTLPGFMIIIIIIIMNRAYFSGHILYG